MRITPTTREIPCPIADKSVRAVLRRGGLLGGPAVAHVRCSETSCQYLDLNEPPCPLSVELFEVPSDRLVADRVRNQTEPTCLECVAIALHVTHDQVRRALWPLTDHGIVRVRPGRCRTCRGRRVVIDRLRPRVPRERPAREAKPNGTARSNGGEIKPVTLGDAATTRLLACLVQSPRAVRCPACLALAAGASLSEVRGALTHGAPLARFVVAGGACSDCGRDQAVLAAAPSWW